MFLAIKSHRFCEIKHWDIRNHTCKELCEYDDDGNDSDHDDLDKNDADDADDGDC